MDEIKNTAVKKRKKKRSTNPAVRVLKILGTALLSIFLILIITCSIFATVLTIYVLNFADTTTTISLDKTETSNISRFCLSTLTMMKMMRIHRSMTFIML